MVDSFNFRRINCTCANISHVYLQLKQLIEPICGGNCLNKIEISGLLSGFHYHRSKAWREDVYLFCLASVFELMTS